MGYLYEQLGHDRFQQLCQAILVQAFPNIQCFPIMQPDGGRDAEQRISHLGPSREAYVFQVKFAKDPNAVDPHGFISDVVAKEKAKIERLRLAGAKAYYLLTNVSGTAHYASGSIDKINKLLTDEIKIPAFCWWRDDLDRRLDGSASLKWSYPDVIRASDLLQILVQGRDASNDHRELFAAIRAYLTTQYRDDEEVKFKQVELHNKLFELFVDIPLSHSSISRRTKNRFVRRNIPMDKITPITGTVVVEQADLNTEWRHFSVSPQNAAEFLLNDNSRYSQLVIEGAPGQGKSTITQFVCQVYRHKLLEKEGRLPDELAKIIGPGVKLPLRVDLRDYAAWMNGKNPFSSDPSERRSSKSRGSLESFLAAQITALSGGHEVAVSDISSMANMAPILIVLDGFDEVADIPTRERLIEEISRAVDRLKSNHLKLQVVVTSRPAAFANSPGFPRDTWYHVILDALTPEQVERYSEKWMRARTFNEREKREFRNIISAKLSQPHMKQLAQNAMQLAILLSLIQTRGLSLPDQRTALYEKYMDLFFSREAEKNATVRDHRELLFSLHQYVAWSLQIQAEVGKSGGAISTHDLKRLLTEYLTTHGHKTALVDALFKGMVERVVALVSRVQDTYEFEVQPLREFFCARHLYVTAPYSPPGAEKKGTKPDRFNALAQNSYWLNVTRFYCGNYSSGELSSLVDGISELDQRRHFQFISSQRILALALLSDYVFTQQPRLITKLIDFVNQEDAFRRLVAVMRLENSGVSLSLPEGSGRSEIRNAALKAYWKAKPGSEAYSLGLVISENLHPDEAVEYWRSVLPKNTEQIWRWLLLGKTIGVFSKIGPTASPLVKEFGQELLYVVYGAGRSDLIEQKEEYFSFVIQGILAGVASRHVVTDNFDLAVSPLLETVSLAVSLDWFDHTPYEETISWSRVVSHKFSNATAFQRQNFPAWMRQADQQCYLELIRRVIDVCHAVATEGAEPLFGPLQSLVEVARNMWGEQRQLIKLATCAAALVSNVEKGSLGTGISDSSVALFQRVRFARLRAGVPSWWLEQLNKVQDERERYALLLICLVWGTPKCLASLQHELSEAIHKLSERAVNNLIKDVHECCDAITRDPLPIEDVGFLKGSPFTVLITAVAGRCRREGKATIVLGAMKGYKGTVAAVWESYANCLFTSVNDRAISWKEFSVGAERCYQHNIAVRTLSHSRTFERMADFPLPLAKQIAKHQKKYPLDLVRLAQAVLSAEAGKISASVGSIASEQRWFSE